MRKYELAETTRQLFGQTLHRIRAVRDFSDVHAGDLGGWISNEYNLNHCGDAWVYDEAMVFNDAQVRGNAKVREDAVIIDRAVIDDGAEVSGDAIISSSAKIEEYAKITGSARVTDHALVRDHAHVDGYATISDGVIVSGNAVVRGKGHVDGNAKVRGNARIESKTDYICIGPIGSRSNYTTFYRCKDGAIKVACGCFDGTIDAFARKVAKEHGDDRHGNAYSAAIELARTVLTEA